MDEMRYFQAKREVKLGGSELMPFRIDDDTSVTVELSDGETHKYLGGEHSKSDVHGLPKARFRDRLSYEIGPSGSLLIIFSRVWSGRMGPVRTTGRR